MFQKVNNHNLMVILSTAYCNVKNSCVSTTYHTEAFRSVLITNIVAALSRINPLVFVINRERVLCEAKLEQTPLQTWTGPEGSRRLRLPVFMTVGT